MMKNLLIIFFLFISYNVVAQRLPSGIPTQFSTGWFKQGYQQSDSGSIIANRDTTWLPKYSGTMVFRPSDKKLYYFDSLTLRWNLVNSGNNRFGIEDSVTDQNRLFDAKGYTFIIDSFSNYNLYSKVQSAGVDRGVIGQFRSSSTSSYLWNYSTVPGSTRSYGFNAYGALTQMFAAGHVPGHATYVQSDTIQVILEADPNRLYMFHDSTVVQNITGGEIDFRIRTLPLTNDTTNFKPVGIGPKGQFKRMTGWPASGAGAGLTSVGLSMPSAFSVSGSPLTSNGTINVSGAGTTAQYIRGNGTLATTDTGMIPNFHLKVRSLFTGSSPITFNQTTGIIGINNATASGTKGAASFTSAFSDNGAGLIDLADLVSNGSCTGCNLNINSKGQITGYSDGAGGGINNVNIGGGFRPVNAITQEMRTYFAGFGQRLDSVANANGLTWSSDTTRGSGLPSYFYIDSLFATIGAITADNGLTKTGDNIQLGGAIIQPTNITSAVSVNRIIYNGVSDFSDGPQLEVTTSGSTGIAVSGGTADGRGVFGQATTGVGVYGTAIGIGGYGLFGNSVLGNAIYGQADSGVVFEGAMNPTSNTNILPIMTLLRSTQSTPANGMGQSIDFYLRSTVSNQLAGQLAWKWTNATDASRTSQFEIYGVNAGAAARKVALSGTGQWIWDGYPALTAQADTTTYKPVAIDGSGNVVKMVGWSGAGGGGGSATASQGLIAVGSDIRLGNTDSSSTGQLTVSRFIYGAPGTKLDISRSWLEPDTTRRKIQGQYNVDSLYYLGDSHTVGDLATTVTRRFSTLTAEVMGYAERNYGVGGTALISNSTIFTNIPLFSAATPNSFLIINFGTNDARNAAAGVPGFDTTAFKVVYSNWVDTAVVRGWPLNRIIIKQMEYSTEAVSFAQFLNFKNATRTIALVKGVLFDPTWDRMAADAGSGFVASDGYHPNDDGHAFSSDGLVRILKGEVKNSNQVMAINGVSEFQTLRLKNLDSAQYTTVAIGQDSLGNIVRFHKNAFIRNNTNLSELEAANFAISGMGYASTALRSSRLEVLGASSARDVGVPAIQAWVDGSNQAHLWAVNWATSGSMPFYLHEFGGSVQVGPGTLNTSARLSVGGNIIATGSIQASGAFAGNSIGAATQVYYAASGYGGLQAYDFPNSLSKPLAIQEFGGNTLVGTGTDAGSYKLQVEGESFLKDKVSIGRMRIFQNQGIRGLALLSDSATYIDNNTPNSGTVAHVAANSFLRPNLSAMGTSVTFTNASTVYIDNSPSAVGLTVTNPWSLYINAGKTRLGTVDSTTTGANVLYQDPITGEIKKTGVTGGATTIYNGDGTISANRNINANNTNITWQDVNSFRINYDVLVFSKADATFPFSSIISGADSHWQFAFTPIAGVFSKGNAITVDTNNNVSLGVSTIPINAPLYSSGGSGYVFGFQSGGANYYKVSNVTTSGNVSITDHFITIDATAGAVTLTLPAASVANSGGLGIDYIFKRLDNSGNTITIQRAGSDTIDGATSFTLTAQYESKSLRAISSSSWALY